MAETYNMGGNRDLYARINLEGCVFSRIILSGK